MIPECNECRFYAGANFCAHCGRPTRGGAALESEEVMAEGVVELERGNCCRTRADEEGWGHIRIYVGAHWPAPKHSRRVRIVAVKEE